MPIGAPARQAVSTHHHCCSRCGQTVQRPYYHHPPTSVEFATSLNTFTSIYWYQTLLHLLILTCRLHISSLNLFCLNGIERDSHCLKQLVHQLVVLHTDSSQLALIMSCQNIVALMKDGRGGAWKAGPTLVGPDDLCLHLALCQQFTSFYSVWLD